jgi:hypothetical protein
MAAMIGVFFGGLQGLCIGAAKLESGGGGVSHSVANVPPAVFAGSHSLSVLADAAVLFTSGLFRPVPVFLRSHAGQQ